MRTTNIIISVTSIFKMVVTWYGMDLGFHFTCQTSGYCNVDTVLIVSRSKLHLYTAFNFNWSCRNIYRIPNFSTEEILCNQYSFCLTMIKKVFFAVHIVLYKGRSEQKYHFWLIKKLITFLIMHVLSYIVHINFTRWVYVVIVFMVVTMVKAMWDWGETFHFLFNPLTDKYVRP